MIKKIPCEVCQKIKKKHHQKPDCDNCLPELLPENQDAIAVYSQVRNQAIYAGMDAIPVDLNYGAVKIVMDMYGIENQPDCFQKVLKAWNHIASIDRLRRKKDK